MKSVIYNQDTNEVVAIINNENGEIFCLNEYYLKSDLFLIKNNITCILQVMLQKFYC